jgi:hypothetical protein
LPPQRKREADSLLLLEPKKRRLDDGDGIVEVLALLDIQLIYAYLLRMMLYIINPSKVLMIIS